MALLSVRGLRKVYSSKGAKEVEALKKIDFTVEKGEFIAIMGESGSGKTTLLNILALLDKPTEGEVFLGGTELSQMSDQEISAFRRSHLGYVFQEFNLLDTFTLQDNILLPLVLAGEEYLVMRKKMLPIVEKLGIEQLIKKYPYEVSGGEKQRAAVARALITNPDLILADEPTGALDSNSSDELLRHFTSLHEGGQTILMVTHSLRAASFASRVLFIKDGKIFHQLFRSQRSPEVMYEEISKSMTMLARGVS